MINKLSIRLLILQILSVFLFSQSGKRFYSFYRSEFYECLFRTDNSQDCFKLFPGKTIGEYLTEMFLAPFYGLLFGLFFIGSLNWIKGKHVLNTILVILTTTILFFTGVYKFGTYLDRLLYSFNSFFTTDFGNLNLIISLVYVFVAIILLWLSMKDKNVALRSKLPV